MSPPADKNELAYRLAKLIADARRLGCVVTVTLDGEAVWIDEGWTG